MSGETYLVPIGSYGGPFFMDPNSDQPEFWQVRIGREVFELATFEEVNIWYLARGARDGDRIDHSRAGILEAAATLGIAGAEPVLDRLMSVGLVIEVGSPDWPVERFAAQYTVQPLMVGVGNIPGDLDAVLLGVDHAHVYAQINDAEFRAWMFAHLSRNLLHAAEASGGSTDPSVSGPEADRLCRECARLVGLGAAYFDRAAEPAVSAEGTATDSGASGARGSSDPAPGASQPPPVVPPAEDPQITADDAF